MAAWTSRTSTCGSPVSHVTARSASWSASRWTASMSFCSSASVIGWSGRLRSWLCVVVNPLTSSPAIPMTTSVGRKPAISSASWSATAQLSTTAAMSATVPDCMCERPWRLRPTPRTVPCPEASMSKTSALANSVPTSSAVQAASASVESRCQIFRQKAIRRPSGSGRLETRPDRREGVAESVAAGALPLGHLRAAAPPALHERHGTADEVAGGDATADERGRDADEQLGLVGVHPDSDHGVGAVLAQRQRVRLHLVLALEWDGVEDEVDVPDSLACVDDGLRAARPELLLERRDLGVERRDPVSDGIDRLSAECGGRPLQGVEPIADERVRSHARDRLDAAHPRADAPLAGDEEAADLATRPSVRPAAQLEAVVLDADRPDGLAVLLVEEGVGATFDRLGHAHERDRDGPVLANDAMDLVLDRPQLVVGQSTVEREVEAEIVRRHQRARLACPLPDHVAQCAMEQMRPRVIAHRARPPLGIHDGLHGPADLDPAVERASVDDQATERLLGVRDGEQIAAAAGSRRTPWSPTWPPPSA